MRQHPTPRNSSLDHGIQLFVTTDGELQVSGSDAFYAEVFGGVTCWQRREFGRDVSFEREDRAGSGWGCGRWAMREMRLKRLM